MLLFNLYLNTNILSDSDFDREGQKVPLGEARSNQTSGKTGFLSKLWGDTDTGWGEERHWLNMVKLMMAVWIVYFLASAVRVEISCWHCSYLYEVMSSLRHTSEKVPLPAKNDTDLKAWSVVGEVGWNEWGDGEMCCHISVHAHTHAHKRIGKWFWNDGWGGPHLAVF